MSRLTVEARRAQLLETAIRLAEQRGISAVSARDVAREAGVSIGVVHYCYESKERLMTELAKALSAEVREAVDMGGTTWEAPGEGIEALRSLLGRVLDAMWQVIEAHPTRQLLSFEISTYALRGEVPERLSIAREQYVFNDFAVSSVLELCRKSTKTRWVTSAETLSRFSLNFIEGLVLRWLIDQNHAAVRDQLAFLVEILTAQAREDSGGR